MAQIKPTDILPNGTPVRVGSRFGHVVGAEYRPAHNGGMICVHTVQLTSQRKRVCGNQWKTTQIDGPPAEVNYSFINTI